MQSAFNELSNSPLQTDGLFQCPPPERGSLVLLRLEVGILAGYVGDAGTGLLGVQVVMAYDDGAGGATDYVVMTYAKLETSLAVPGIDLGDRG